jgi:hypothetical protein
MHQLSLRNIEEEEESSAEVGNYDNLKIAVGYSPNMRGYYVKVSDIAKPGRSVFVINRSESGYLAFIGAAEFLSSLHRAMDNKGMYLEGNELELAKVVSDLTVQLMERKRNEGK